MFLADEQIELPYVRSARERLGFDAYFVAVPNLRDGLEKALTEREGIVFNAYSHFLTQYFQEGAEQHDKLTAETARVLKEQYPDYEVSYQHLADIAGLDASSLALTAAWTRELRTTMYATGLESSFVAALRASAAAGRIALHIVEKARSPHAQPNNQLLQHQPFDADIPFIFGALLRQSNRWSDVISVANQMRSTRKAQAFRDWAKPHQRILLGFTGTSMTSVSSRPRLQKGLEALRGAPNCHRFGE